MTIQIQTRWKRSLSQFARISQHTHCQCSLASTSFDEPTIAFSFTKYEESTKATSGGFGKNEEARREAGETKTVL